jgi:ribosomal protein S18 acetylase RimI-like enzyme
MNRITARHIGAQHGTLIAERIEIDMSSDATTNPAVFLLPTTRALIDQQRKRQLAARSRIKAAHGSLKSYISKLEFIDIDRSRSPLLQDFYALYEKAFSLAEEREPLSGFETVLAFNQHAQVQAGFGPFYEAITIVRDYKTVIAAANYTIMSYRSPQRARIGFDGSCQLNFICVDKTVRGVGLARALLNHVDTRISDVVSSETAAAAPRVFITCEQNNPARMTQKQIETDAAAALIDPLERTRWWSKLEFSRLDFPYEQPPLSVQHQPCAYIDYYVRIPNEDMGSRRSFQTRPLLEHLRRFFFVCVGKFDIDMTRNEEWLRQKKYLEEREHVPVHQPVPKI